MAKRRKMYCGRRTSKRRRLRSNNDNTDDERTQSDNENSSEQGDENSSIHSPEASTSGNSSSASASFLLSPEISCNIQIGESSTSLMNENIETASCSASGLLVFPAEEEYIFSPIVTTDSIYLSTPPANDSFNFLSTAMRTDDVDTQSVNNVNVAISVSEPLHANVLTPSASSTSVEIIDLDKLPDPPNSPIGDDVVEILAPVERSSHRRFIDLTDHDDPTPDSNAVTQDSLFSPTSSDHDNDELPIVLNVPSLAEKSSSQSEEKTEVSCPICMDTVQQISESNRKLMSTRCGHVFCDECITKAFAAKATSNCPKCRKKIQKKQMHPIFL